MPILRTSIREIKKLTPNNTDSVKDAFLSKQLIIKDVLLNTSNMTNFLGCQ